MCSRVCGAQCAYMVNSFSGSLHLFDSLKCGPNRSCADFGTRGGCKNKIRHPSLSSREPCRDFARSRAHIICLRSVFAKSWIEPIMKIAPITFRILLCVQCIKYIIYYYGTLYSSDQWMFQFTNQPKNVINRTLLLTSCLDWKHRVDT